MGKISADELLGAMANDPRFKAIMKDIEDADRKREMRKKAAAALPKLEAEKAELNREEKLLEEAVSKHKEKLKALENEKTPLRQRRTRLSERQIKWREEAEKSRFILLQTADPKFQVLEAELKELQKNLPSRFPPLDEYELKNSNPKKLESLKKERGEERQAYIEKIRSLRERIEAAKLEAEPDLSSLQKEIDKLK